MYTTINYSAKEVEMPKIELQHRTSLSASEIKEKAEKLINNALEEKLINDALEEFKDKISDAHQEWRGNTLVFSFRVMGLSVSGQATAYDNLITIKAKLPFAAGIFKGKIRDKFNEKAKKIISVKNGNYRGINFCG